MDPFWIPIARWMLHAGLGGGLILALTLLAMRRVRQPARRQRLGEAGAGAALALAVLACGPAWIAIPIGEAPAPDFRLALALVPGPAAELPAPAANLAAAEVGALEAAPPQPAPSWFESFNPLLCVLVLLYAAGAMFFLARWCLGLLALRRILRASQPAGAELLAELAGHLPRGSMPRLMISPRLRVPISCGAFRPTVILPAALAGAEQAEQRQLVFAHELTHLERRDAWSCVLLALAQTVYFAVPWFWRLQRQVRLCQEYVADAAAARRRPADEYAEFLLSLIASPAAPRVATGVSGAPSDLYRRVTMLLENPMPVEKRCPYWWSAGAAGALVGLAVVGAGVSLAQAPPNQQEVLQQLERIQDMVNKLRNQLAEGAQAEARRKAITVSEQTARELAEQQQLVLRELLAKQAATQKAFAQKALAEKAAVEAAQKAQAQEGWLRTRVAEVIQKPETERAELIRRIFLDLRGTLPTVEEVRKYLAAPEKMITVLSTQPKVGAGTSVRSVPPTAHVWSSAGQDGQLKQVLELLEKYKAQLEKQPPVSTEEVQKRLQEVIDRLNQALKSKHVVAFTSDGKMVRAGDQLLALADPRLQPPQGRLGVRIEAPSAILSEQLNLPKGQGLVVAEIFDNSVAKKVGIQVNDILLKINNEPVSSDAEKLVKTIADMKPDQPFDIVVLRRGKEQAIGGVKLAAPSYRTTAMLAMQLHGLRPQLTITLQRSGRQATISHNDGALAITVKAAVADGKAKLQDISIAEKGQTQKYGKAEEVPAEHRDKVHQLLQILNAVDFRALPSSSGSSLQQQLRYRLLDSRKGGDAIYQLEPAETPETDAELRFHLKPAPVVEN
jgi:beta-lactamase regulating signal transducer with metallopeptidase domain